MSSTDPYGTRPFNRNDQLKASQLESMRQGNQGNVQIRNPDNYVRRLPGGHILTEKRRRSEGGGSALSILKITAAGANINTYTASIIDNRTDETVIEAGVTLKALDHSDGTIPNGVILTCTYDSENEFYEPTNYAVFYGS